MSISKSCRHCHTSFEITDSDLSFYDKVSPVFKGKKYVIPPPTLCSVCRDQRRLSFRNERSFHETTSAFSKQPIIAVFSPDKPFKVITYDEWWSERCDNTVHGKSYDFSRPFFEQFQELFETVPQMALIGSNNENCGYCHLSANNKNCYLLIESSNNQDSYYSYWIQNSVACNDSAFSHECQYCYEIENCLQCYNLFYARDCLNCSDSYFMTNCQNCRSCFGCTNLRNKEYHIFNKPVSKTEYEQFITTAGLGKTTNVERYREQLAKASISFPKKYAHSTHSEDCTGDYHAYSKNCRESYHCHQAEDCAYAEHVIRGVKDAMDVSTIGLDSELIYESINTAVTAYRAAFVNIGWNVQEVYYSMSCMNNKHLFGCVGLKGKEYCILNKQYSKEEYEKLVPRIIEHMQKTGEWGEFFPSSLSPFGYNETVAQEYYPLHRDQVIRSSGHAVETHRNASLHEGTNETNHGNGAGIFNWSDYESPPPQVEKIITNEQMKRLPDDINDIPDDILNWALTCEVSGKLYRIIKQELKFYREHHIPVPRKHPDQRHTDRMAFRNPRRLWERQCDCENRNHDHVVGDADRRPLEENGTRCPNIFQTSYAPDRKEMVYCEDCYLKEVY